MATQKITTNLFSFKTFRSPDKIDFNEKNEYYIHHPNFSKSKFNQCPIQRGKEGSEKQLDEFLNSFKPASSYKQIREINPSMYDYSCLLMQQRKNDSSKKQLNAKLPPPLKEDEIYKVWDELFIQTAIHKSATARQACIQLIITQHYLQNNKTLELKDISKLVVVISDMVIECFKQWRFSKCGGKLFGVHNLGIQEYRRVEQTLCCYVPGEVSHIENIMAREYKEKSTRNLLRTEYTTEFTSETEIENLNDTTTTERHELSTEAAKELQKDKSFNISGSVTVSKDSKVFGSITANVSSGYNSSSSSTQSNTEAKNYAKEITERALERVVQKTTEKRTYKMIKEFEENNKHGFDNREGKEHVTGVYRWVDKIYDNELVNYGRRLLFEITVPSPADFYKKAMVWISDKEKTATSILTPPLTLEQIGLTSIDVISKDNYRSFGSEYGVDLPEPLDDVIYISDQFSGNVEWKKAFQTTTPTSIPIPPEYIAKKVTGFYSFAYEASASSGSWADFLYIIGSTEWGVWNQRSGGRKVSYSDSIDRSINNVNTVSVHFRYRSTHSYSINFTLECYLKEEIKEDWQNDVYNLIKEAYEKKLDKYNEELKLQQAAQQAEADQQKSENYSNPAMNRLIEERELKRICIEMMSKPYCYDMGKNFVECIDYNCKDNCGEVGNVVTEVVQNSSLEQYAEFIKFFETAFHWEIFSYIFYPYYYNAKCQWSELLQTKNDDPIFEAFLQSGMAKILVPVRPQFEKAVMWYIETGEIYTDENLVPEFEDDRYLSLLAELQNQDEIKVEGIWKTRVPSTLTIIQAKSTYLVDENGLPCCEDEAKIFRSDDRLLESKKPE